MESFAGGERCGAWVGGRQWMGDSWKMSLAFSDSYFRFHQLSCISRQGEILKVKTPIYHVILSPYNPFTPHYTPSHTQSPKPIPSHSPHHVPADTNPPAPAHAPPTRTYSVTPAPSPLPSNHTLSPHLPTLTPTSAHASSTNLPPNASFTAPWPTPSRLHSTGSRGVVLAPGGTSNGRS